MEYLPLFANLRRRTVLVVGGGHVAARKIELLMRTGAQIRVVARELCPQLTGIINNRDINWLGPIFEPAMLDEVFLVIAATDDAELNARVYKCADERHTLVNVVDEQQNCSFIFPSIVDRSPIIVAISSSGKAPVLARIIREQIESMLPMFLGTMATIAGTWRSRIKQYICNMAGRRSFWEKAFNGSFANMVAQGKLEQAEQELEYQLYNCPSQSGNVALVGAGPGDSGLLTLRGLQLMQQADVVLYDYLVNPEIIDLVRRDADRVCVGKRVGEHSMPQAEINRLLVKLAQQGKNVVRLKGGDPFIFGRGGEELQEVAAAGISFQVVPGITAAAGATAYAGIPLTHREYAQSVTFITGHPRDDGDFIDWPSLARCNQTLVVYMGVMKAAVINRKLVAHGRAPQTPVAVISRGTYTDQKVLIGTLEQLEMLALQALPPALLVIGDVVALSHEINWFGQENLIA
ncbi:siroheme synthase CysG [Candidatus Palibaumannia cicadellinicola]|uniref:siroheme synthase CysG n=1 Tax=Candidatus Palibaumannia cicadellinicola TaxID=186490 RepID=UPI00057026D5|nr:siroheme synthase CysG [Candidatus Baumannia cicadellinicola]